MSVSLVHSNGADGPITIPAIGLDLMVRMAPAASGGAFSIIETINATLLNARLRLALLRWAQIRRRA
jgi:hypothetical protein